MLELSIKEKRFHAAGGGGLLAIKDLHLAVGEQEFVCLTGPSGCGKTTALRILLGLEEDFDGEIRFANGEPRIGMVFQEPRLLPWYTLEQNVRLVLPKPERQRNLDPLFEILGLSDLRGFYPGELSLGLARRAALARAFAIKPDLLVLDEPFVSLDQSTASRLRNLLVDTWQSHPSAVIMVTHDWHEAVELADRIVVLSASPGQVRGDFVLKEPRAKRNLDSLTREITGRFSP